MFLVDKQLVHLCFVQIAESPTPLLDRLIVQRKFETFGTYIRPWSMVNKPLVSDNGDVSVKRTILASWSQLIEV